MDKEIDNVKHHSSSIIISGKEFLYISILFFCSFVFVFASGYFLGKKRALEELASQYDDEYFADKVNQSLSAFYDQGELISENSESESLENASLALDDDSEIEKEGSSDPESDVEITSEKKDETVELKAYAQLCGFSNFDSAQEYQDRLKKRGIQCKILERKTRSKQGRIIIWYQVATEEMSKEMLLDLIEKISKEDRLVDVCIVDIDQERE